MRAGEVHVLARGRETKFPRGAVLRRFSRAQLCNPVAPLSMGFSSENPEVGCRALLQGVFPTQAWNLCFMTPALAGGIFTSSATWEAPPQRKRVLVTGKGCRESKLNRCLKNVHLKNRPSTGAPSTAASRGLCYPGVFASPA